MTTTDVARPAPGPASPPRRRPRRWSPRQRERMSRWASIGVGVVVVVAVALSVDFAHLGEVFLDPQIFRDQFPEVITIAARNTLVYTVFAFAGGLTLGMTVALLRLSTIRPYRVFGACYVELFRGLPALLTIILIGYGLPIGFDIRFPTILGVPSAGIVALSIVAAAYMAETIRAGIEAVPVGQMEAARSLGMTRARAMTSIVVPQAFRIIVPPLTNEFVLLLKDSALLYVLGVTSESVELTKFARDGMNHFFNDTPITVAALMYLLITIPLTRLVAQLEKRNRRSR
jgi:polar amino acid transport system permease protein